MADRGAIGPNGGDQLLMAPTQAVTPPPTSPNGTVRIPSPLRILGLTLIGLALVATDSAAAQTTAAAFCSSELVTTIRNVFTVIQFGGPLIGGVIALAAMVLIPTVRQVDHKKELKELRDQGIVWGVIVAPLGTVILSFILNYVVAGGTGCGF